jgi:hypothetical protein
MKIPDKVRVGSIDYDVTVGEDPIIINGVQALGCCDYMDSTIKLDKSIQGNQQLEVTFLHELIHTLFNDCKIDLVNYGLEHEQMEYIVDSLAYSLHQVIRDNKEIFMMEEEDLSLQEDIKELGK